MTDAYASEVAFRDVELAVIGLAVSFPDCADRVAAIDGAAFASPDLRAIHGVIRRMRGEGRPVDMVTVSAETPAAMGPLLEAAGKGVGPSFLAEYERILADKLLRRRMGALWQDLWRRTQDPGEPMDRVMSQAMAAMTQAAQDPDGYTMEQAIEAFQEALDHPDGARISTGIATLDAWTGGLRGGQLIILAARPGVGKSALALHMADHAAARDRLVLYVTLEMRRDEVVARQVARESKVSVSRITGGRLELADHQAIVHTYGPLSHRRMIFNETANTPAKVRRAATAAKGDGLALVVVDHMQLMEDDERRKSRYEEITAVSRKLKQLAMDLDVPVLALCQMNRESEAGGKRRPPTMAEARDSGAIEQDANLFLLLSKDEEQGGVWQHVAKDQGAQLMRLEIAKNRQGPTGCLPLGFVAGTMDYIAYQEVRNAAV